MSNKNITIANRHFDRCNRVLRDLEKSTDKLMPLFADSMVFSRKILAMYKEAFNARVPNDKKGN